MLKRGGFWRANVATVFLLLCVVADVVYAQEMDCYGSGSIAGAVIGTFIVTLLILGLAYLIYKKVWKPRREKHLVLETDPEQGDKYAFDNPCFKDAGLTPIGKALDKSGTKLLDTSTGKKWSHWSPLGALVSTKNEKKRTMDDSYVEGGDIRIVSLRSHDFTGLGFNVCGNMRDGIYIKDILHRGPASESGKLNPGDRIKSVRISFEHMVYEDALTILSYASPYEVQIEAQGGFKGHNGPPGSGGSAKRQGAEPRHPMYRSSSSSDLILIGKSARHRLFQAENVDGSLTEYSTLQLSSNNTTLERGRASTGVNSLAKPERSKKPQNPSQNLTPEQLKSQLEQNLAQKISQSPDMKHKDKKIEQEVQQTDADTQNKNRFQKFGVRVLPPEIKSENLQPSRSPKSAELSQNDNNINLERNLEQEKVIPEGIDEVDKTKLGETNNDAPPIKRREKPNKTGELLKESSETLLPNFERQNSLNGSGIKRDKAGIPQEIPDHMLKAAVAARKNRKSSDVTETDLEESETAKTPKKQKGKAPAPPPEVMKQELKSDSPREAHEEENRNVNTRLNFTNNFDEISTINDKDSKVAKNVTKSDTNKLEDESSDLTVDNNTEKVTDDVKEYCSDSDVETDNQSSVNTIELNASDITIHHSEEDGTDIKGRKTASTGDLSKIQKAKKTGTGTLERAQSLDITDSGIPTLTKKRKAAKEDLDSKLSSDESLYEKTALKNKEPRLSLALDGLDTFQRNRLKKSSEWGNLQDVVMHLDKVENDEQTSDSSEKIEFVEGRSPIKFNFGVKDTKFGNSVTHITDTRSVGDDNEISINSGTISLNEEPQEADVKVKNVIWPNFDIKEDDYIVQTEEIQPINSQVVAKKNDANVDIKHETNDIKIHNILWPVSELNQPETETKSKPEIKSKTDIKVTEIISDISENNTKTEINESRPKEELKKPISPTEKPATSQKPVIADGSFSLKAQFQERLNSKMNQSNSDTSIESTQVKTTNHTFKPQLESSIFHPGKSSQNFIFAEKYASNNDNDGLYNFTSKLYDTNVSDDIKVSRHSLGSLERPKSDVLKSVNKLKMQGLITSNQGGVSNVTVTENKPSYENGTQSSKSNILDINTENENKIDMYDMSTASELYTTAIDSTIQEDKPEDNIHILKTPTNAVEIKNITITETINDNKLISDSPSSLTIDTSSDGPDSIKSNTLTFVTEIQVSPSTNGSHKNVSEIIMNAESRHNEPEGKKTEETLKKLPEMKFTTSSYESPKTTEKRVSHIELLRSNFERSPPKSNKLPEVVSPSKSRIPVATKLDLKPSSPERREFKIDEIDTEEKEIVEIMSSAVHSTPVITTNQRFVSKNPPRNVTVTSIRTSSKIPSGQHTSTTFPNKPPVPARPTEHADFQETRTISANGSTESTFKQWVFNPSESSVTNIIVNNKEPHK